MSVSSSDGKLTGSQLNLGVRLPIYEVDKLEPAAIASAFRFAGAKLLSNDCERLGEELVCRMSFAFDVAAGEAVEVVDATVTLSRITVPNHVHIMKLTRAGITRQGVFDRSFESEKIDFHQDAPLEAWWRGARQGFAQIAYQPMLLLLLLVVGYTARPPAYLAAAAVAFFVVLPDRFYAPASFFQIATVLSIAYLVLERWLFPDAGAKWVASAAIGAVEGAAIAVMARAAGSGAIPLGLGNLAAQALLSLLAGRIISSVWIFVKRS